MICFQGQDSWPPRSDAPSTRWEPKVEEKKPDAPWASESGRGGRDSGPGSRDSGPGGRDSGPGGRGGRQWGGEPDRPQPYGRDQDRAAAPDQWPPEKAQQKPWERNEGWIIETTILLQLMPFIFHHIVMFVFHIYSVM